MHRLFCCIAGCALVNTYGKYFNTKLTGGENMKACWQIIQNMLRNFLQQSSETAESEKQSSADQEKKSKEHIKISQSLKENLKIFERLLGKSCDINIRHFTIGVGQFPAVLLTIDGLVDKDMAGSLILETAMVSTRDVKPDLEKDASPELIYKLTKDAVLSVAEVSSAENFHELLDSILYGDAIVLLEGCSQALICSIKSWEHRSVSEPQSEVVVRGPREGFNEVLRTNTSLIRRRLRTADLRLEEHVIGTLTHTSVVIGYVQGLVNKEVLQEVEERLQRLQIDGILDSGYISELITDNALSPFPQVQATERPDKVVASLLEGRVAIIVDGTPFVLIVPAVFVQFMQAAEDYYNNYYIATFIRLMRYIALFITVLLPALYIAITTFHQEILPTSLLISIAAAREGVPFPAIIEAFLMLFAFEALREAGIRLPKPIGQTISIVGGLIIGDAAVSANIVSPAMLIVVAITGIASFIIPVYELAIPLRLLNYPLMLLAAALGLYGIMAGLLAILLHITSLNSFGIPYTSPLAPVKKSGLQDTVLRVPWWKMNNRPYFSNQHNLQRQEDRLRGSINQHDQENNDE